MDIKDFTDEQLKYIISKGYYDIKREYHGRQCKTLIHSLNVKVGDCLLERFEPDRGGFKVYKVKSIKDSGVLVCDEIEVLNEQVYDDDNVEYDVFINDFSKMERISSEKYEKMLEVIDVYNKTVNDLHDKLFGNLLSIL
jgi:hypothetical protein